MSHSPMSHSLMSHSPMSHLPMSHSPLPPPPPPLFISQKPIFKSSDVLKWAATIDHNADSCAVWHLTAIGTPEVKPEEDCSTHMHSICIQLAGNQSYQNFLMNKNALPHLLTSTKFLNYLLSEISSLEAPDSKYASDIGMHLSHSATHYAENIGRKGFVSYTMLAAAQHSVSLHICYLVPQVRRFQTVDSLKT